MNESQLICSICQQRLSLENCRHEFNTRFGNNAQPVNDGRCCDNCNDKVVIPARINAIQREEAAGRQ